MKTLYLHIGCGKTGSSALQVWLNNSHDKLESQGVNYPYVKRDLLPYHTSIGNGFAFITSLKKGCFSREIDELFDAGASKVLLSSEAFQDLADEDLLALKIHADRSLFRVVVIAYVRDVYDVV